MQNALGLLGDQVVMFAFMIVLGGAGIAALFLSLFWRRRWRLKYRMEILFVVILVAAAVYADNRSAATYKAYEADLPRTTGLSGKWDAGLKRDAFDQIVKVYAFQWGFAFVDDAGAASRNAVKVKPGAKVLFALMSNDVIHGFNIPAARMTTEFEPGSTRYIWIRAPKAPGKYLIQCLNYCGVGHSQMKAWLIVGNPDGGDDEDHS